MNNEKFTPGPWRIEKSTHLNEDGRFVHSLYKGTEVKPLWFMDLEFYSPDGTENDQANANLIASAPILFSELKRLIAWIEDLELIPDREESALSEARNAVNKALGL